MAHFLFGDILAGKKQQAHPSPPQRLHVPQFEPQSWGAVGVTDVSCRSNGVMNIGFLRLATLVIYYHRGESTLC